MSMFSSRSANYAAVYLVESQSCLLFQRIVKRSFFRVKWTLNHLHDSAGQIQDGLAI